MEKNPLLDKTHKLSQISPSYWTRLQLDALFRIDPVAKGIQRLADQGREKGEKHFVNTLIIELENDKMDKMRLYSVGKTLWETTISGKPFCYCFISEH